MARAYLSVDASRRGALVVTGDRMVPPGFDRWRSDPGTVYADGGTAVVLSKAGGVARLRSLATVSDPRLEGMHRAGDSFGVPAETSSVTVDLEQHKRDYVAEVGVSAVASMVGAGQQAALESALEQAGVSLAEIRWFVLPQMGLRRLQAAFFSRFDIPPEKSLWEWSKDVGHLGAGDPFAGLDHLLTEDRLRAGELCLLASTGAGFSWSCAIVEATGGPR